MSQPTETSWTMIEGAARGDRTARSSFGHRFQPIVRSYLMARWKGSPFAAQIDDAVQEVFVDCFQTGGALDKVDAARGSFRAFLFGVVRNVALRFEKRQAQRMAGPQTLHTSAVPGNDGTPSAAFDAAWAQAIMSETAQLMAERCTERGGRAARRVDLLRMRFHEQLPIRDIAEAWNVPAPELHKDYELAREEFRRTLHEVVEKRYCCPLEEVAEESRILIDLLNR